MYKDELSVFIPNSFLSESKDLKVRTFKVGILGRALAVFQIDNVVIYNDDHIKNENGEEDGEFIAEVLNYMNLLKVPKGIIINFNCFNIFREGQKTFVNEYFKKLEKE